MKKTGIFFLMVGFTGNAFEQPIFKSEQPTNEIISTQQYSSNWIDNFRAFRTAVYQADKTKVKSFIDFPIMNENNEIWYLVNPENENLSDKIKPFTEKDFDQYFGKLFTKEFKDCIQKIKTQELYNTGYFETIEFHNGKETAYKMYATVDKKERSLTLNLAFKTMIKDSNDAGESNILYYFKIEQNEALKFIQVRLAG